MKIIVTENQFRLLELFANKPQSKMVIDEVLRPLEKLKEFKFTHDGKYVVYQGRAYKTANGEEVPINESWTLSDILHTGADIVSAGLDFVFPGSGAVVDVLNALSYIIEAQFKSDEEKDSLYLMAAITFAFVILPGPLQALAVPLKRAIKTGVGMTSSVVVQALKIIGGSLDTLLGGIPTKVNAALKSPLAKNILGSYRGRISGFITAFTTRIKSLLNKITGKAGKEGLEKSMVNVAEADFLKSNQFGIPSEYAKLGVGPDSPLIRSYFSENAMNLLLPKIKGLPKQFNPSKVNVLKKTIIGADSKAPREAIEVTLENNSTVIFYKSSGSNLGTTGKKAGEWFVIPGIGPDGWFVKTKETINLSKGGNPYLTEMAQFLEKNGAESLGAAIAKKSASSSLTTATKTTLSKFFTRIPKITNGTKFLKKLGFVPGKTYSYIGGDAAQKGSKVLIDSVSDSGVMVTQILKDGSKLKYKSAIPVETFVKNAIGAPWTRRGAGVVVPLFVKRLSDMITSNGEIDYAKIEQLPDLDPNQTSTESLQYLQQEVASYEGDKGSYKINNNAKIVQQSLMKLGYPLPRFKDDGKFGPETMAALKKFQQDNGLTSSIGKMDKLTSRKLSELLKSKNIAGSEQLQSSLNSM